MKSQMEGHSNVEIVGGVDGVDFRVLRTDVENTHQTLLHLKYSVADTLRYKFVRFCIFEFGLPYLLFIFSFTTVVLELTIGNYLLKIFLPLFINQ